ncbi:LPS export ABC transporter periplasmic protein LptC [Candidatus Liberibacter sp.]|uniref:LPS export ABC transporter periplasmic protein LptC n=1 Tax=Candidatus Liberibacter sp. TaxID=34022 RepID=UPI0015F71383|nr:LPS export ABC transporter periplasmic protein LptC [Candidatus Liberibacter sp.]MBA5723917.1 LPS export ABC transporter periplasmic protein LptC [Candidatus Liberibacter sp.]
MARVDQKEKKSLQREKAYKHSRCVLWLKIVLPIITIVLLAKLVFSSYVHIRTFSQMPEDLLMSESGKMFMKNFKIANYDGDKGKYVLNADYIETDLDRKKYVLKDLKIAIPAHGYDVVHMTANSATFDLDNSILGIKDPFMVKLKNGTQMYLQSAIIKIKDSTLMSSKPLIVTNSKFLISAGSVEIEKAGEIVNFSGEVGVIVQPGWFQRKDE